MRPLRLAKTGGDPPLMALDALAQARDERAPRARKPQAVRAPVDTSTPLDQAALFERVDNADHRRAIKVHRFGEPALRDTGIRLEQEQDSRAAGRYLAHACREIPEHR